MAKNSPHLKKLAEEIVRCRKCPRLREHCEEIARIKRRSFQDQQYWGKPITGFGPPDARLMIVGLAPAAHGANRTGRIFTGDRSGDWLYAALHRFGFANQPNATNRNDGLVLQDTYVTCVVKCAPPDNKPEPAEQRNCTPFLSRELEALKTARVWIALGQFALNGLWPLLVESGKVPEGARKPKFGHGLHVPLKEGNHLILSYHPSQQNTFTGKLTEPMFHSIFEKARELIRRA